jgi:hypothetical protein
MGCIRSQMQEKEEGLEEVVQGSVEGGSAGEE